MSAVVKAAGSFVDLLDGVFTFEKEQHGAVRPAGVGILNIVKKIFLNTLQMH